MATIRPLVDVLLTNVSSMIIPTGMIAETLLPNLKVKMTSGKLAKYGNKHLQLVNSTSGGRGAYRRVETRVMSTTTYVIEGHGLEGVVTKDDYRNTQLPFNAEKDETTALTTTLALDKELTLANSLQDPTIITQNVTLAGGGQLSDYTNSDPFGVFSTARSAVRAGSAMAPNTAILDWNVANTLRYHPKILASLGFQYNRVGELSNSDLARALGVQNVLITEAVYNASKEGQTDAIIPVWGKNIVFAYVPDSAQPYQTSLGYYITYEDEQPRQVYKYSIQNPPEATGVLVEDNYAMLLSNTAAAYLIRNAVA